MTNTALLRKKIDESGYKIRFIASKMGISYQCLLNKMRNETSFRAEEILRLCDILSLNDEDRTKIFFCA